MKSIIKSLAVLLLTTSLLSCNGQNEVKRKDDVLLSDFRYFNQKPPGDTAVLFAPKIITYETHDSPVISINEDELFFLTFDGVKYYKFTNDSWPIQNELPFEMPDICNGMHISPNGDRIYYLLYENGDENFYVAKKSNDKWSSFVSIGDSINQFDTHWQFCTASNNNFYFSSNGVIMISVFEDGNYRKATPVLIESSEIMKGGTPYIAKNESYLIYSTGGSENYGMKDLHICYKKNNTWSKPINLGYLINDKSAIDVCPVITPNEDYMFFVSRRDGGNFRLYWVDTGFIEKLKKK